MLSKMLREVDFIYLIFFKEKEKKILTVVNCIVIGEHLKAV